MKIFDCCLFNDEKMLFDLRLNILNNKVDKFIVVEANFTHNGEPKNFNFDINDYSYFKEKIIYIKLQNKPKNLHKIKNNINSKKNNDLKILNALILENYHRNKIMDGLNDANTNDLIIISDVDEIPNLDNFKNHYLDNRIILFKQKMFYYKFNLKHPYLEWFGSKATLKKNLKSPQWLRNIKNKIYPKWRLDVFLSNNKSSSVSIIEDGGWHFTNIKEPKNIFKKYQTFLHHIDFEESGFNEKDIEEHVEKKIVPYGHNIDKKKNKWKENISLESVSLENLPLFIKKNFNKYINWIEI